MQTSPNVESGARVAPTVPERMSAVVFRRYGGPEVLEAASDVPVPPPRADEVLVRVRACAVNPADAVVRAGDFRFFTGRRFPKVPGADIAGEVVRAAHGFEVGERVFGMLDSLRGGGYAQYASVSASALARVPVGLRDEDAAAVPLAALTAWQALAVGGDRVGGRVLVIGAGGGVGSYAVQLARDLGGSVTALCSRSKHEFVRALGASELVDREAGYHFERRFDFVFDAHGGAGRQPRAWLVPGGLHVTVRPSWLGFVSEALAPVLGPRTRQVLVRPNGEQLAHLAARIEANALRSTRTRTLPLADAARAHAEIESGRTMGKLVLRVD